MRKLSTRAMLILVLFLSTLFCASTAEDTLTPAKALLDGESLVSAGGTFVLGFFSPTGSTNRYVGIWYNQVSVQTVVWVANRQNPITDSTGALAITSNGTLILTGQNSTIVWSVAIAGMTDPVAQILDTGNFVIREAFDVDPENYAWQGFDHPTDTLLPGMKLGWNLTAGLCRNFTAWTSPSDPSPGPYTMSMDIRGDPQVFLYYGATPVWRAGPWDGIRFAGLPEMTTSSVFNFTFVNDKNEIYYSYLILDNSIISRLYVTNAGTVQRSSWVNQTSTWSTFWFNPKDQCDTMSQCGPFGVCNSNKSPICGCLQGFQPTSPANWAMRYGFNGCKRMTPLDCKNGTDGFLMVSGTKLPDTSSATVDMSMSPDECSTKCLGNCSCTAYATADISGAGRGCITWNSDLTDIRMYPSGGQDIYVRLAAADLGPIQGQSKKNQQPTVGLVVGTVLGILLLAWVGCYVWRKKKRRGVMVRSISFVEYSINEASERHDTELRTFELDIIMAATNGFCHKNKLGEGGFGPVYKGTLGEEQEVAVKRLSKTSMQGLDEFKNEVMLIAKLQHRNLVRLLGCCTQGDEWMLIYEYMPNKSLDFFLFDKAKGAVLDWQTRYRIILGIARGLLYLHQDSRFRIIHRDLKASNILLDKEMNPKISDFGMARIFGGDETEVNTRKVVGTYGYMAPEYAMDGIFSVKSDVFSFGVLILEIISGQKNRGVYLPDRNQNLLGHAWQLWQQGNILELVDDSLGHSLPFVEVLRCIKVGLLCVQEHPEDRPPMSSVILMLGSDNVLLPHPKNPGFVAARCPFELDTSSSKQESCSINKMTITILDGR